MKVNRPEGPKTDGERVDPNRPSEKDGQDFESLLNGRKSAESAPPPSARLSASRGRITSPPRLARGVKKGKGSDKKAGGKDDEGSFGATLERRSEAAHGARTALRRAVQGKGEQSESGGQPDQGASGSQAEVSTRVGKASETRPEEPLGIGETDASRGSAAAATSHMPRAGELAAPLPTVEPIHAGTDAREIQQIAQKLLAGLEIHKAANRTEVHLQLDLGRLGAAEVQMHRDPKGELHLSFGNLTESGQSLLLERVSELTQTLQQRGMPVAEVKVAGAEIRFAGPQAGRDQQRSTDQGRDDGRRSRGELFEASEEEES